MPSLLESLESLFGTADLYEVLQITKEATPAQIRKAYHKVSLFRHFKCMNRFSGHHLRALLLYYGPERSLVYLFVFVIWHHSCSTCGANQINLF